VRVTRGALPTLGRFVRALGLRERAIVVSDAHVAALHGTAALRALRSAGLSATLVTVPAGERSKSAAMLAALWRAFAEAKVERGHAVVALGGGVVGDLAGFAAATHLRGLPQVMAPTSLVAQVDSSIGGKVGIDLPWGKNLAGAFYPPRGVLVDPLLLATLPDRELRSGLAEVVKTGMVAHAPLFRLVESAAGRLLSRDARALEAAVGLAGRTKARIVSKDERDHGPRSALNFGHTLGHAIETALGFRRLSHGEAVAIGMRAAGRLSRRAAGLSAADARRLEDVLDRLGLPGRMPPLPLATLLDAMARDKKRRAGTLRWVLTPQIGFASVPRPVESRLVRAVLLEVGARE